MRPEDLFKGLNNIDDDLIEEALKEPPRRKRNVFLIPVAAAACMMVLVGYSVMKTGLMRAPESAAGGPVYTSEAAQEEIGAAAAADNGALAAENAAEEPAAEEEIMEEAAEAAPEQTAVYAPLEETVAPAAGSAGDDNKSAGSERRDAVGIADKASVGEIFTAASDYDDIFEMLKRSDEAMRESGDLYILDGTYTTGAMPDVFMEEAAEDAAPKEEASSAAEAAPDHSTTNVMVEGIDESDIVKTDGRSIYRISGTSVIRTDIREGKPGAEQIIKLPEETASDDIRELFLDGDSLIVIGERFEGGSLSGFTEDYEPFDVCREMPVTFAAVYDISGEEAVFTGMMTQDGYYKTARKTGEIVTLFTDYYPDVVFGEKEEQLKNEPDRWVPHVNGVKVAADCIYMAEESSYGTLVSTFGTKAPEDTCDAKFIFMNYAKEYIGSSAIWFYYSDYRGTTRIISFPYRDGRISAGTAGSVRGEITDSFAISESPDALRVLATDYSGTEVENSLYLLDPDTLSLLGRLDGIARGEIIYSARYIGGIAYFVTYRNTDPLFAADISDVSAPKLLGELKITGFSEYLHPWDETHILGLGYETDPESGQFLGIKLTMFDVSDPADIRAESVKVLEEGRSSSAIDSEYKAVFIDTERGLVGFPDLEGDPENVWDPYYRVFAYSSENGFVSRLSRKISGNGRGARGVFAGETFYIVDENVTAFDMNSAEWGEKR